MSDNRAAAVQGGMAYDISAGLQCRGVTAGGFSGEAQPRASRTKELGL